MKIDECSKIRKDNILSDREEHSSLELCNSYNKFLEIEIKIEELNWVEYSGKNLYKELRVINL